MPAQKELAPPHLAGLHTPFTASLPTATGSASSLAACLLTILSFVPSARETLPSEATGSRSAPSAAGSTDITTEYTT